MVKFIMIPKIRIGYSDIYDIVLRKSKKIKYNPKKAKKGEIFAKKLQIPWNRHEKQILERMAEITGLKWPRNLIECHVSFNAPFSFSAPLTVEIDKDINYMFVAIAHELCHVLFWGNKNKVRWPESNTGIYRKYKKESYNTRLHFPVHALLILTFERIFGKNAEKYLKQEQWWKRWPKNPMAKDYKRSWEIVKKEGPENILKQTIKTLSKK